MIILLTMFLACGDKAEDTALVDTQPSSEPATEEQTEETGSTEEPADTATSGEQ